MQSEIHWQGIGIRTKASREGIEQELKVASHSRTFREMEMSTNSSIDAEILNSGTLQKKRSYNMNNLPNSLKPA